MKGHLFIFILKPSSFCLNKRGICLDNLSEKLYIFYVTVKRINEKVRLDYTDLRPGMDIECWWPFTFDANEPFPDEVKGRFRKCKGMAIV